VRTAHRRGDGRSRPIALIGPSVESLADHSRFRRSIDAEADRGGLDIEHFDGSANLGNQNPFVQTARQDEHGTVPFREREVFPRKRGNDEREKGHARH
jgi:hypothetical protein